MTLSHAARSSHHDGWPTGRVARTLAASSLAVLASGAAVFGIAWAVGGEDAVSDNWVGLLVMLSLYAGLLASLAAFVAALVAGRRREPWARLWLPLATFPFVVVVIALLEGFVFE